MYWSKNVGLVAILLREEPMDREIKKKQVGRIIVLRI